MLTLHNKTVLAYRYLSPYDGKFLMKAYKSLKEDEDYDVMVLLDLMFEALRDADNGVTYDIMVT